jgi:pimeloyl-[acyl-carrier protein] methyl ester esterase
MNCYSERFGSGPDVVLLHGWGLHGGLWGEFAEQLANYFTVTAIDLPGHGGSPQPETALTIASMTQAVSNTLAAVQNGPATVVGWSLGAFAALDVARLFPQRFDRLVWIAGTPSFVRRPGWPMGMAPETLTGFADGLKHDYRATLKRFISLNSGRSGDRALLKAMQDRVFDRGEPSMETLDQGLAILRDSDEREQLANLVQPLLLIQGNHDRLVHPDTVNGICALHAADVIRIDNAGHAPFLAEPARVAQAIRGFVG